MFERSVVKQVGMESEQPSLCRKYVLVIDAKRVLGRQEDHGGGGEIVIFPSATAFLFHTVFYQQDGIEIKSDSLLCHIRIVQADDAGLWVQGFASQAAVALVYGLDV